MEFTFEANPDLEIAVGSEVGFEEALGKEIPEDSYDLTDLNPVQPTGAKPGSEEKVRMLSARYAAGTPLWHDSDCYDHGPAAANGFGDGETDLEDEDF